eukprot:CAMPEP_0117429486 /NCGR_PEP_ID=MMETSP0758-20121206/9043_1 /TAXON_ID=63605 /ORGANISM="Percolomonas cosmopolitus, Strain AE-1 (ATCC 50343)" /LENGTH=340 /DNA_ID=CAMNT_0005216589 /DNA_START=54 /DNA_END=1073 /DNA_ORIENTATION=+
MSFLKRKEKIYHYNDPIDPDLFSWHPWGSGEPIKIKDPKRIGGLKTRGEKKGNGNDALFGYYPYMGNGPPRGSKRGGNNNSKPWRGGTGKFDLKGHYEWIPEGPGGPNKGKNNNKNGRNGRGNRGPGIRLGNGTKNNTFGTYPYMSDPYRDKKKGGKRRGGDWKPNSWEPKEFNRFQALPAKLRDKRKRDKKKGFDAGPWRPNDFEGKRFAPHYHHVAEPYENRHKEAKFTEKPWYPTEVHKHGPQDNWINTEYVDEDHLARDMILTNKKENMAPDALVKQRANHRPPGTPETRQMMHVGYGRKTKPSDLERMNELKHYRTTRAEAAKNFDHSYTFTSKK